MFMIAFLCLLLLLLLVLLRRPPPPPHPAPDDHLLPDPPHPLPPLPPLPLPLPTRHVSFSLVGSDTSYSLPVSPPPSLPIHRRWSSSFHRRKPAASASPCAPQPNTAQNSPPPADQFGRLPSSSSSAFFDMHPSPMSPKRLSTPLRLSLTGKRRSSSVSWTSTSIQIDQIDTRTPSPPPSKSALHLSPPPQRTRFINPFRKYSRSRTLSPPSIFKSLDTPSNPFDQSSLSPPPLGRRSLVNKFKSIFKSTSPESSPIIRSKPIVKTINTRLRRKPVARTQPYGPPWNAPMPAPDFSLSQHSLQKHAEVMSPSSRTSRKCSVNESSVSEKLSTSPGQLSPHTFVNELDERLSLLQQQRIQDPIPLLHE